MVTSGWVSYDAVLSEVINVADPNQNCDPLADFPMVNVVYNGFNIMSENGIRLS